MSHIDRLTAHQWVFLYMIVNLFIITICVSAIVFWLWFFRDVIKALFLFPFKLVGGFLNLFRDLVCFFKGSGPFFKSAFKITFAILAVVLIPLIIVTNFLFFLGLALFLFLAYFIAILVYNIFFN